MINTVTVGPFQENCFLLVHQGELAVIDPGDEAGRIIAAIEASGARPRYILLTHGHLDHVGATGALQKRYGIPLYAARAEAPILQAVPAQCALYGLPLAPAPTVDTWLDGHETLNFGDDTLTAIPTPGHSPGGMCYRLGGDVFVGDTIFAGSVGRTDLMGGSWAVLEASIEQQLFTMPDEVRLHPGHGPSTTVGAEKRTNPFFS